jgi:hypothetical protein
MDIRSRSRRRLVISIVFVAVLAVIVAGVIWVLNTPQQPNTNAPTTPTATKTDEQKNPSNPPAITAQQVKIAYIAVGDSGQLGEMIGCGDSVVIVSKTVQATSPVEGALQTLLADKSERYGTSGLRNALWQSTLTLDAVTVLDKVANVKLSGNIQLAGVCDIPRVKAQLETTTKESSGATAVSITVNGATLDAALSLK